MTPGRTRDSRGRLEDAPEEVVVAQAMGGELIQLDPGAPKEVDAEGFDVDAGDELSFDVKLFDHPLSVDEFDAPHGKPLAAFVFHRKVGEGERTPPADLAAKQCQPLG